jgi:MYXO-CTERM domain-containing protein
MGACTPVTSTSSSSSSSGEGGVGGAGVPSGAGAGGTTDSGCACRVAGHSERGKESWGLLGVAIVAARRVRRIRMR